MAKVKHFAKKVEDGIEIADNQGSGGKRRSIARIIYGDPIMVAALAEDITVNGFPLPKGTSIDVEPGDEIGLSGGGFLEVETP